MQHLFQYPSALQEEEISVFAKRGGRGNGLLLQVKMPQQRLNSVAIIVTSVSLDLVRSRDVRIIIVT